MIIKTSHSDSDAFKFIFSFSNENECLIEGKCYSGTTSLIDHEKGGREVWAYEHKDDHSMHEQLSEDSNIVFTFLVSWRGVWDNRIYFPENNEFRSEEFYHIVRVWKEAEERFKHLIRMKSNHVIISEYNDKYNNR